MAEADTEAENRQSDDIRYSGGRILAYLLLLYTHTFLDTDSNALSMCSHLLKPLHFNIFCKLRILSSYDELRTEYLKVCLQARILNEGNAGNYFS